MPYTCKAERKEFLKTWRSRNKDKLRAATLKYSYKMTLADYERMEAEQGGLCAICRGRNLTAKKRVLDIDHDHATGTNRALLCGHCNKGLGHFKDSPDLLVSAAEYLVKHGKTYAGQGGVAAGEEIRGRVRTSNA
jgi:hypothetical protein